MEIKLGRRGRPNPHLAPARKPPHLQKRKIIARPGLSRQMQTRPDMLRFPGLQVKPWRIKNHPTFFRPKLGLMLQKREAHFIGPPSSPRIDYRDFRQRINSTGIKPRADFNFSNPDSRPNPRRLRQNLPLFGPNLANRTDKKSQQRNQKEPHRHFRPTTNQRHYLITITQKDPKTNRQARSGQTSESEIKTGQQIQRKQIGKSGNLHNSSAAAERLRKFPLIKDRSSTSP